MKIIEKIFNKWAEKLVMNYVLSGAIKDGDKLFCVEKDGKKFEVVVNLTNN